MPALKGAFINLGAGLLDALPNIVVFQFNPVSVTRTPALVQPPPPKGEGQKNTLEQPDQPTENISFSLRIDATDQLAEKNPIAAASGILPTLSALELLMIPKSSFSLELYRLSGKDSPAMNPPLELPTVLFFWGAYRILPVTIDSLSINETEYDPQLNPIRAEVSVSLKVLLPSQVDTQGGFARGAYRYSQGVKEVLAALNQSNAVSIGVSPNLSSLL